MRAIPDEHLVPPVGVTNVYAYTADHGVKSLGGDFVARQQAVVDLMQGWDAKWYLFGGDNSYNDGSQPDVDTNWSPWSDQIDDELVYPAFGNHDLDSITDSDLLTAAQFAKFPYLPQDRAYYAIHDELCSFYFLNSGLNTSGTLVEPTGNDPESEQWEWLLEQINESTAHWQIVIMHHPGWTSSADHFPGNASSRWDWRTAGIDLVLHGHAHNYERQVIDRTNIVVAGNGGNTLASFGDPVDGSVVRLSFYGGVRLTVTANTLDLDAIETTGFIRDRLNLYKDRLIASGQPLQYITSSAASSGSTPVSPTNPGLYAGVGNPNGVVTANLASLYFDVTTPSSPVQYIKTTGSGNTGWI